MLLALLYKEIEDKLLQSPISLYLGLAHSSTWWNFNYQNKTKNIALQRTLIIAYLCKVLENFLQGKEKQCLDRQI